MVFKIMLWPILNLSLALVSLFFFAVMVAQCIANGFEGEEYEKNEIRDLKEHEMEQSESLSCPKSYFQELLLKCLLDPMFCCTGKGEKWQKVGRAKASFFVAWAIASRGSCTNVILK